MRRTILAPTIYLPSARAAELTGNPEVVPAVVATPMQRVLDVSKLDPGLSAERVLARIARGDRDIHVGKARAFRVGSLLVPETLFRLLNRAAERSRVVIRVGEQAPAEVR